MNTRPSMAARTAWVISVVCACLASAACKRQQPAGQSATAAIEPAPTVLYYFDPMRPDVHFDKPGKSPFMDMANQRIDAGIQVDAVLLQSLGMRVTTPNVRDVQQPVFAPAKIVADARGIARVQARVDGNIERLLVRAVGQPVKAGQVVAEIYSAVLVQAQEELLLGDEHVAPARERLLRLGIAAIDIDAVVRRGASQRRLPIRAPVSGVVTELGVREGANITSETLLMDLTARNTVWLEAALFPSQLRAIDAHAVGHFSLPGAASQTWRGTLMQVLPMVDALTQTVSVRFSPDQSIDLPFGTTLTVQIDGTVRSGVLLVPASAIMRTPRGDHVIVAEPSHRFSQRTVQTGERYGDEIEIVNGVAPSDQIVVAGQFLLDAEANLQDNLDAMNMDGIEQAK
jgi:membrane fusion protein, copper/silver efflux system